MHDGENTESFMGISERHHRGISPNIAFPVDIVAVMVMRLVALETSPRTRMVPESRAPYMTLRPCSPERIRKVHT